ncbi:LOW QUALITY PROTEIN: nmrA-like family domain-containing protein 1 [Artibeus jamaicensis]|uniref:LOW QUALITY PROTEIN: nmrA-like family domain-containing protein 1 n=1 Tax=Artibeus jamaicensis TaxID=9417 RepID=UPI00235AF3F2|nr:LOW QUALITY PROTEIN: nmrA-like family domain-containing protein 1 [Artibeus jamaicensis]
MTGKKVIAVFGATGAQGRSVAKAILESKKFALRVLTRDVTRPNAPWDRCSGLGTEVVKGNLKDEASVEAALKDACGASVVTSFWGHLSKEKEVCQGKLVADVAKHLGLKYVVYSGLENNKRLTGGKLEVEHFDGKGEVEEYFWSFGVPMTSVCVAAYFENFLTMWKAAKAPDGDYFTFVWLEGGCFQKCFSESMALNKFPSGALVWLKNVCPTPKGTRSSQKITPEAYERLGFPGAKEMADVFCFYHTKPDCDVQLTQRLNPKVKSFSQFIPKNQGAFTGI